MDDTTYQLINPNQQTQENQSSSFFLCNSPFSKILIGLLTIFGGLILFTGTSGLTENSNQIAELQVSIGSQKKYISERSLRDENQKLLEKIEFLQNKFSETPESEIPDEKFLALKREYADYVKSADERVKNSGIELDQEKSNLEVAIQKSVEQAKTLESYERSFVELEAVNKTQIQLINHFKIRATELKEWQTSALQTSNLQKTSISSPFKKRKITLFHHHHKSGGTMLCTLARKNKMITPAANCLVDNSLTKAGCCGKTISQQKNFARTTRYTFVANELYLPDVLDHTQFNYVTVVRNPWERYVSHYNFAVVGGCDVMHCGWKNKLPKSKKSGGSFTQWLGCQMDNFYVRNICGEECLHVAKGKLEFKHLEIAMGKLREFDAVLILESLTESLTLMKALFNWRYTSTSKVNASKKKTTISDSDRRAFGYMTLYDDMLYSYAKFLNQVQLKGIGEVKKSYEKLRCGDACCCGICNKIECYNHPFSFMDKQSSIFCSKWR